MPAVKKVEKKKIVATKKKSAIQSLNLSLPTERSVPSTNLRDYTNLFYGKKKIGKTTLSSHFPDTIHFMFEAGSKALAIYARIVPSWEHFLGYINLIENDFKKEKLRFKNAVIDTGAIAYDRCLEYICKREGINHPSDLKDWGANWKKISQEFERAHTRLSACGLGLLVIAHEKTDEIELRDGKKYNKIIPALSGQAEDYYAGAIDNIFYYEYVGDKRFLTIRGSQFVVAGTRCENNFLTPDGEEIYRIPMGKSSKEAYNNLLDAFNNKQIETYKPETKRKEEKEIVVAKKKNTKIKK